MDGDFKSENISTVFFLNISLSSFEPRMKLL